MLLFLANMSETFAIWCQKMSVKNHYKRKEKKRLNDNLFLKKLSFFKILIILIVNNFD